jgi:diguanylate cyclase (GGDEF)-like protein
MKSTATGAGHITLLERVSSAPFERVRRVLVVAVLLLGAVASLAALYLQVVIEATNPVDLAFLPLMFVLFLGMGVALVYRPDKLQLVENAAYLMLVLYGLSMLVFQVRFTLPELHTFTETMFWFPMLYLVAYLLHRRAMAFRIAAGIWLLALLLGLLYTPFAALWRSQDAGAFNALLQFYISGIVYVMLLYAFSRIEESYAENRMLAYLDHLTQLPNRRYGEAVLVQLFRQVREHGGTFSVIMLDLDGFKKVNDRHGHDVGDRVLKRCALLIQRYLPRGARVIRWGGEEFLIVLPDYDEREARRVAEEVRRGLENAHHEGVGTVLASLGVAGCRPGDTLDLLIQRADQAMYRAKQAGGNRVATVAPLLQTAEA